MTNKREKQVEELIDKIKYDEDSLDFCKKYRTYDINEHDTQLIFFKQKAKDLINEIKEGCGEIHYGIMIRCGGRIGGMREQRYLCPDCQKGQQLIKKLEEIIK